ncbi:ABC transporter ATP-binding protein [Sutcliffiella cohnii]|uniref:ABC transporter ATP-binding protein n=1 Tax=Sutcliffiella cohnii TaxID=33932 RepID=UPI002E1F4E83|nr:ABC transporter ATP-binding protein [Sutcliffiella cohnii]
MNVIECEGLSKKYGRHEALRNISFTLSENKIVGVIGRNGAGKTTLLKIIAGFYKETSGRIHVFGEKPFNSLLASVNCIYIDDYMSLPTALNLSEILQTCESFYPNWDRGLAEALFDYFQFQPKQRHNTLSKGKRNTFYTIIGLASRCPLTIFDEPTTGMDAAVRKDFYRALLKDYLAHPRTILLSSHHLEEIEDLLEEVLLIKNGETFLHTSMDDLKEYAIGLSGKKEAIETCISAESVLYEKELGLDSVYKVVKNSLAVREACLKNQVVISPVSAQDVAVYLTANTKGGIDDVFRDR